MGGRFGVRAGVGAVVALALVTLGSGALAQTAATGSAPAAVVADDPASVSEAAPDVPEAAADVAPPQAAATPGVTLRTAVYEVQQLLDRDGRVERRLVPALDLVAGDELRYVITVRNETGRRIEPGRIEVRVAVPADTLLLPGSAGGAGTLVEYALGAGTFSPHLPMVAESAEPVAEPVESSAPEAAAEPAVEPAVEPGGEPVAEAAVEPTDTAAPRAEPGQPREVAQLAASTEPQTAAAAEPSAAPADGPPVDAGPVSIRWTYQQPMEPTGSAELFFHIRLE